LTQPDGSFEYRWIADTAGLCAIQASWAGDNQYTGAMSPTRNTIVVPFFITVLAGVVILVIVVSVIAVVVSRQTRRPIQDNGNPTVINSYQ
jgi:heme/copper-type cytochrome/quinol oxidase subunit 2